jgi:hypothetical protein
MEGDEIKNLKLKIENFSCGALAAGHLQVLKIINGKRAAKCVPAVF